MSEFTETGNTRDFPKAMENGIIEGDNVHDDYKDDPKDQDDHTMYKNNANGDSVEGDSVEALKSEMNLDQAIEAKDRGNELFRQKRYEESIECYSEAIYICPKFSDDDTELQKNNQYLATFYGNRAAAYAAEKEYQLALEDCIQSLDLNNDYVKVLGRRMQCYEHLDKIEEALTGTIYSLPIYLKDLRYSDSL